MANQAEIVDLFKEARGHLRAAAFRMLGSLDDAEDALQEAWLRAARADVTEVVNVTGWLTTVVGRVCLDMLRSRRRRAEDFTESADFETLVMVGDDPAGEAVLAESVGLALLVVLNNLSPAERVAFVLHDVFAVPFDQIAQIVDRTPMTAKKLASRARQRVRGVPAGTIADLQKQRQVVDAFLAASRAGDLNRLMAVLDPDVVRTADALALASGVKPEVRGARAVAEETAANAARARFARVILVDGAIGAVVAPRGRLQLVLRIATDGDRVTGIDVIAEPSRLSRLSLTLADAITTPAAIQ